MPRWTAPTAPFRCATTIPRLQPLLAVRQGSPPCRPSCTCTAAAEYDPLRDDSATLAAICEQYGTPVRYEVFEGVIHAFLHYTKMLDAANDALEHGATFYREQLGL